MINEELVKLLKKRNGKAEIFLAADEEGNSFAAIEEITILDNGSIIIWPNHQSQDYDELEDKEIC